MTRPRVGSGVRQVRPLLPIGMSGRPLTLAKLG